MLHHAIKLASAGYHVFPLRPGTKIPFAGSRGHHDASTDRATITSWWTAEPTAGIGIACDASGLVVIDIDPRNGGDASFRRLEADLAAAGCPLPDTAVVKTGGGGWHIYYHVAKHVTLPPNLARAGYPGIDIKHAGYVVAPPTLHESGARYEWAASPWAQPIAPLPTAAAALFASTDKTEKTADDYTGGRPASPELLDHVWRTVVEHGPSVKGRGGDAHAYQLGAILLTGFDLTWDDAWAIAQKWNDHFPENAWAPEKLALKLRNGARYGTGYRGERRHLWETARALGVAGPKDPFVETYGEVARQHASDDVARQHASDVAAIVAEPGDTPTFLDAMRTALADFKAWKVGGGPGGAEPLPAFRCAAELVDKTFPPTNWLVRGLITGDSMGVIGGEAKSSKTWAAFECGIAIATGTPAFGEFDTGAPRPVAFFLAEDSERSTFNRFRALVKNRNVNVRTALSRVYYSSREALDIRDDVQLIRIVASVRVLPDRPALVVVDPLRDVHGANEDKSDEMADVMMRLRALRDLTGASIMFVHHSNKASSDNSKRRGGQRLRGSGAIHGAVDFGLYVGPPDGDKKSTWRMIVESEIKAAKGAGVFRLELHVDDDANDEAIKAAWKVDRNFDPDVESQDEKASTRKTAETRESDIIDALVDLGGIASLTTLRNQLRADQRGMGTSHASAALDRLRLRRWVTYDGSEWKLDPVILQRQRAERGAKEARKEP